MANEKTLRSSKKAASNSKSVAKASKEQRASAKKEAAAAAREAAKAKKRRQAMSDEKLLKVVNGLIEGAPGVSAPRPLPLSALTKHKGVAWQWLEEGRMRYPIPIGCNRPLSPFNSD
ncbi:unnamed protein product [Cladocopium goreaui]|uniref:Uncharacterized protein n=1 Tax=Cladocopium goreaui TaxID=2562237 RepID=A0A9P1GMK9_9DINO|nr:unnamed protein product [Cladocopium goreaui]|mmetsp:Transcript_58921/g.129063  ORF Transcript_58921/g.129063 Transcript_58921/m.129063 type:complete len:117 (+) Transcript_58921:102-452(+)